MPHGYPDFEGPKIGVYLIPEWAAREGTDKTFLLAASGKAYGQDASTTYTVPSGKTLYLHYGTFTGYSNSSDFADLPIMIELYVYDFTSVEKILSVGGCGGGSFTLPKPVAIAENHQIGVYIFNRSKNPANLVGSVGGYEA